MASQRRPVRRALAGDNVGEALDQLLHEGRPRGVTSV